ncbi:hypothetical protein ACFQVA_10880 [Actinomadura keratinilytica]
MPLDQMARAQSIIQGTEQTSVVAARRWPRCSPRRSRPPASSRSSARCTP